MAQNNLKVLLGYEDEPVLDKHNGMVNFTTNKIGGKPNWPTANEIEEPACPLCEFPRPLVIQIYAPLENSSFHRTLYLFACINPNCWNQNDSWICLRSQVVEQNTDVENVATVASSNTCAVTDWCQDADDWDDNNANINEENGNLISPLQPEHPSDDEESCSIEEVVRVGLGHLTVDDRNANTGAIVGDLQGNNTIAFICS
ncbi:toys are us [Carabus blaptoides fortunei]